MDAVLTFPVRWPLTCGHTGLAGRGSIPITARCEPEMGFSLGVTPTATFRLTDPVMSGSDSGSPSAQSIHSAIIPYLLSATRLDRFN